MQNMTFPQQSSWGKPVAESAHNANLFLGQYVCFKKNFIDVQRPAFTCTSDPIMCVCLFT